MMEVTLFDIESIELAEKILLRDFISFIADISDIIEDSSDKIELIRMTRSL